MESKTDRELIIQVDNKVDRLADSVDRFIEVVKNIEAVRLEACRSMPATSPQTNS